MFKKALAILLLVCTVFLGGCSTYEQIDECKYDKYVCYDYRLRFLDFGKHTILSTYSTPKNDPSQVTKRSVFYLVSKEPSEDQFVAMVDRWWDIEETLVLQNPTNRVDVLGDWTVGEILLYTDPSSKVWEKNKEPDMDKAECIEVYSDSELCTSFSAFVTDKETQTQAKFNYDNDDIKLRLQARFVQSSNLVWDVAIRAQDIDGVRVIAMDLGEIDDRLYIANKYVKIPQDTELYRVISAYIDTYLAE